MTERAGGSDVTAATQTVAVRSEEDGVIRLYGNKFYTSAIDCQVSLVLARFEGNLSLFLVHLPQGWFCHHDSLIQSSYSAAFFFLITGSKHPIMYNI